MAMITIKQAFTKLRTFSVVILVALAFLQWHAIKIGDALQEGLYQRP